MSKQKKASAKPKPAAKTAAEIEAEIEALNEQKQEAEERQGRDAEPKLTPEEARLQQERDRRYEEHREEIDRALALCTGHLKKLDTAVAREAIRRLEDYYLLHGIR